MTPIPYSHIVNDDGHEVLSILPPDGSPIVATGDHPHFETILENVRSGFGSIDDLRELADLTVAVERHMLSERVSVVGGRVLVDGDEIDSSLADHIVRVLKADGPTSDGLRALAAFLEKLLQNPSDNARDTLYGWLSTRPFSITASGDLIAYKGVDSALADENNLPPEHEYESCFNGPATVNGVPYDPADGNGVPQSIGDVVELARSEVDPDAYVECSEGLHVGTHEFASTYGDTLLVVTVNPRDVVGVPYGVVASEKIRVCRYLIWSDEASVEFAYDQPVVALNS